MFKLEIINGSLQVSFNGEIILVSPKESCATDVLTLYLTIPFVTIYNKYLGNNTVIFNKPLSDCEDDTGTPFTINSFIAFAEANLGFYTSSSSVPDATPTVKGIAKLYDSLGNNTDGAVDQNTISTAINLKANLQNVEQIIRSKSNGTFGSHTGDSAETVVHTIDFNANEFEAGDWMTLLFSFEKDAAVGNVTWRLRAGVNGNTSDNQIATVVGTSANSRYVALYRGRPQFLTGNQLRIWGFTQGSNTDISSSGTASLVSLTPSNAWKLTVTAQLTVTTETASLTGYRIGKIKSF